MEKKHNLTFCPECGVKLDGDEMICAVCGYKLAELHPVAKAEIPVPPPPPPPPVQEPVIVPPAPEVKPPAVETPVVAFCPNCGSKIQENEMFCNSCGTRLTVEEEKKPADAPPPPKVDTPVVPPPPAPPVAPQSILQCPGCKANIDPNELFCNNCGMKLDGVQKQTVVTPPPPPPPPKTEIPVPPPVTPQPVYQQQADPPEPVYQQQPVTPEPPAKKKGMGVFLWIIIILLGLIIIGGGTAALLQYTGTINVPFLAKFIPSKNATVDDTTTVQVTNYYVVHSFASTGYNKWDAIVSSVIVSKQKYNNQEGAITEFKKAVAKKYPKDSYLFTNSVLCDVYQNLPEAQSGRSSLLKNYNTKKYQVRSVDVQY